MGSGSGPIRLSFEATRSCHFNDEQDFKYKAGSYQPWRSELSWCSTREVPDRRGNCSSSKLHETPVNEFSYKRVMVNTLSAHLGVDHYEYAEELDYHEREDEDPSVSLAS